VFSELQPPGSATGKAVLRSWFLCHRFIVASVAVHLGVLAVVAFRGPRVIDLAPTWLASGDSSHTYHITYLPTGSVENLPAEAKLILPRTQPALAPLRAQMREPRPAEQLHPREPNSEPGDVTSKAGSPLGTVVDGPIAGHEVHVAYPVVYPDPPVNRAELPRDLAGDVVIEVTIDSQGNVVDTRIVEAIGHGIDEKIEATLRRWHYQPATLDGAPVASHHDVHFHFPS